MVSLLQNKSALTPTINIHAEAVVIVVVVHMAALVAVMVMVVAPLFLDLNLTIIVLYMALIHGRCVILSLMATITILLQVAGLPIPDMGEDTAVGMGATTITAKIIIIHFTTTMMVAKICANDSTWSHPHSGSSKFAGGRFAHNSNTGGQASWTDIINAELVCSG